MNGRTINNIEIAHLKKLAFGERIEWFREELNKLNPNDFTSTRVAKHLNISSQGLRNIERGIIKDPGFSVLVKLSELYHVPTDAFIDKFYKLPPSSFTLGIGLFPQNNEQTFVEDINDEEYQICTQTSLIKGNMRKIIVTEISRRTVTEFAIISMLATSFNQMEVINCLGENGFKIEINLNKNSPMMKALQIYNKRHELPWESIVPIKSFNESFEDTK